MKLTLLYDHASVCVPASPADTDKSTRMLPSLPAATRHSAVESEAHCVISDEEAPHLNAVLSCRKMLASPKFHCMTPPFRGPEEGSTNDICNISEDRALLREETCDRAESTKERLLEKEAAFLQDKHVELIHLVDSQALKPVLKAPDRSL